MFINHFSLPDNKSLFWREIKKLKNKETITTISGTENNNEILNLFKEKFHGFDRKIQTGNDDESSSRI